MSINVAKLTKELLRANIEIAGVNAAGVVWGLDGSEIQDRADVAAVIAAHDPTDTVGARVAASEATVRAIPNWAAWTPAEAEAYIVANVTDLASAKLVLRKMALMLCAMRDKLWPWMAED